MNNGIKFYKPDLYVVADNVTVREYFESEEFTVHRFISGEMFKSNSNFRYDDTPITIKGKSHLVDDIDMMKILISTNFPCYNFGFTSGQIYKHFAYDYCKRIPNTWVVVEHKNEDGTNWPTLSPEWEGSIESYGVDMGCIYPGGNIASDVFQILYYMGFNKIITVGLGDVGISKGNPKYHTKFNDNQFEWDVYEIHSIPIHNEMWNGKRQLKILHGGEIFNEYGSFAGASYDELLNPSNKKNKKHLKEKIRCIDGNK